MTTTCHTCSSTSSDQHPICHRCAHRLAGQLHRVPALVAELHTTLARQDKLTSTVRRSADTPMPYSTPASEALFQLANELGTTVRLIAAEKDTHGSTGIGVGDGTGMAAATAQAAAGWLAAHTHLLRAHPAADELVTGIGDALNQARRAIDRPTHRTRFPVGPCPTETDTDTAPCTGQVWAMIPTDEREPALLVCDQCHAQWDTRHSWYRLGLRIHHRANHPVA